MNVNGILLAATMMAATPALAGTPWTDRRVAEAVNEVAITQYEVDSAVAPIKTREDLERHLMSVPNSPLRRMSSEALATFVDSMVFTRHGLASYSYAPLQTLSVADAYAVLSLFGEQRAIGLVPGLRPGSSLEESMLFVSRSGMVTPFAEGDPPKTPSEPLSNQVCVVDSSRTPSSWCEFNPRTMCNPKCK